MSKGFRPRPRGGPPSLPPGTRPVDSLLQLKPEEWPGAIDQFGLEAREILDLDWPSWAHEGQLPPDLTQAGLPWRSWVIMAGRGFGKTLAGAKWLTAQIATEDPLDIALVGATLDEARRVMVEGRSGLLNVADAWVRDWNPSLRRLTFRTGATATLFSGASPEILRGPEHHLAWCDELAKWEKGEESWAMLQLGLRLGTWPRAIVTTTPRPGPVLTAILGQPDTVQTGGPTSANPHVSEAWQRAIHSLYAGTRLGEQELEGRLLTDAPGALWSVELIASCRAQGSDCAAIGRQRAEPASVGQPAPCNGDRTDVTGQWSRGGLVEPEEGQDSFARRRGDAESPSLSPREAAQSRTPREDGASPGSEEGRRLSASPRPGQGQVYPEPPARQSKGANPTSFSRIVIAVDPPVMDGTCGIIACAKDADGRAHILADHSVTNRTPEGWARAVADAVRIWTLAPPRDGEGDHPQGGGGGPALTPTTCSGAGRSPGSSESAGVHPRNAPASAGARLVPSVVAEKNQGGQMVKAVLHTADPSLRVKLVTATAGKAERAAPVAMLFEAGRVVLHGRFPELEAEMLGMIAGGDYEGPGHSPDRADAMVWGLTELMLAPERAPPSIRGF